MFRLISLPNNSLERTGDSAAEARDKGDGGRRDSEVVSVYNPAWSKSYGFRCECANWLIHYSV